MTDDRRMTIRMHHQISGSRHDGRPWPPPGEPFDVPEWEAHDLIHGGLGEAHGQEARARWKELSEADPEDTRHGTKLNRASDGRPPSQVEAEEPLGAVAEAQGMEEGQLAREREETARASRRHAARHRASERDSAEGYAQAGIYGAPGSEVPELEDGDEAVPMAEGVRPASQAAAEDGMSDDPADGATTDGTPDPEPSAAGAGTGHRAGGLARGKGAAEPAAGHAGTSGPESPDADSDDEGEGNAKIAEQPPSPSAPKQAWVDFAVHRHGADVHEVSALSKAELMSRYGGRL